MQIARYPHPVRVLAIVNAEASASKRDKQIKAGVKYRW
jgi:hypothetical protein